MPGPQYQRLFKQARRGLVWVVVDHGLLGMSFTDIARKTGNTRIKVMRAVRVARELLRGVPMEEWVELATRIQGRDKQNGIR